MSCFLFCRTLIERNQGQFGRGEGSSPAARTWFLTFVFVVLPVFRGPPAPRPLKTGREGAGRSQHPVKVCSQPVIEAPFGTLCALLSRIVCHIDRFKNTVSYTSTKKARFKTFIFSIFSTGGDRRNACSGPKSRRSLPTKPTISEDPE